MSRPYFVINPAYCKECMEKLEPAAARHDDEPCFVGYNPCPNHPKAGVVYQSELKEQSDAFQEAVQQS